MLKFEVGKVYNAYEDLSYDMHLMTGQEYNAYQLKITKVTPKTVSFEFVSRPPYLYEEERTYKKKIQTFDTTSEIIELDNFGFWVYAKNIAA